MSKRKLYEKKLDSAIRSRNQEVVLPPVKPVLLPGERPPSNPNTPSGLYFQNSRVRTWNRSDGVEESRVQVYLPVDVAKKLRVHCAQMEISMSVFMTKAVTDLLAKVAPVT